MATETEIDNEEQYLAQANNESDQFANFFTSTNDYKVKRNDSGGVNVKYIKTTPGRILLNRSFQ